MTDQQRAERSADAADSTPDPAFERLLAKARETMPSARTAATDPASAPRPTTPLPTARKLSAGTSPHSIAMSPDGVRLHVTNFRTGSVSHLTLADQTLTTTTGVLENPYGIAAAPDGKSLVVASPTQEALAHVDLADGTSVVSVFGRAPYGVCMGAEGRVYLALGLEDTILVTDQFAKADFATIPGVPFPVGVAVDHDETRLYASCYFSDTVAVIDLHSRSPLATIPVDRGPYGLALSPDGSTLFAAHFPFDSVSRIDLAREAVIDTIPVGGGPRGVALSPAGDRLYVTDFFEDSVTELAV
ncbi:YncE family protein [Streptomyces sp. NPDC101209]|uniref:YncE family protein n=1 Tax=Streptomyces sp. NPDC101209 TaxID=3366129 RepID=UPI003830B223